MTYVRTTAAAIAAAALLAACGTAGHAGTAAGSSFSQQRDSADAGVCRDLVKQIQWAERNSATLTFADIAELGAWLQSDQARSATGGALWFALRTVNRDFSRAISGKPMGKASYQGVSAACQALGVQVGGTT